MKSLDMEHNHTFLTRRIVTEHRESIEARENRSGYGICLGKPTLSSYGVI